MSKDYVYEQRLLKLAAHLDKVRPSRFDFARWAGDDWKGKANLSCGTTACALGLATTIPSFRRLGLRLFRRDGGFGKPWVGLTSDTSERSAYNAAGHVFGVSAEEFEFLFLPNGQQEHTYAEDQEQKYGRTAPESKATPKEVAAHIRYFVKRKYPK